MDDIEFSLADLSLIVIFFVEEVTAAMEDEVEMVEMVLVEVTQRRVAAVDQSRSLFPSRISHCWCSQKQMS